MVVKIPLTAQEREFALACKDFLHERDVLASAQIHLSGAELVLPDDCTIQQAFLDSGVARLLRVFDLAIQNKAIPLEQVPSLISNLAKFNEKLMDALLHDPNRSLH